MAEFTLDRTQEIALPIDHVFDFFSNAANLERITPPEINFNILTKLPIDIRKGTLIDYEISLFRIPVKWRTEITEWNPPHSFIDQQIRGPYRQWIHRHTFTELENGITKMDDTVRYRLPLEPLGDLAHFLVRTELEAIFDYRAEAIARILMPN